MKGVSPELKKKIYKERKNTKWKEFERRFFKGFLGFLYRIVFRVKFINKETYDNFEGPLIVCPNHVHYLDAAAITLLCKKKIRFMYKEDLARFKILRWFAHMFDMIPVNRGTQDLESMKRCLKALSNNETLGIFPEGTRKGLAKGIKPKTGAAFLAFRTGATILPVGIQGSFKPFTKIVINFGEPIEFASIKSKNPDKALLEDKAKEVIDQIIMLTNDKK